MMILSYKIIIFQCGFVFCYNKSNQIFEWPMKSGYFKIVSGGQTGVDRAALDAAIALGLPHGGWCPKGRKAEDGIIAAKYHLTETPSEEYSERTEWNVRDSDATLILVQTEPMGGTLYTIEMAQKHQKPCKIVFLYEAESKIDEIVSWLAEHKVEVLNVAGPRASQGDAVYRVAFEVLMVLFGRFV